MRLRAGSSKDETAAGRAHFEREVAYAPMQSVDEEFDAGTGRGASCLRHRFGWAQAPSGARKLKGKWVAGRRAKRRKRSPAVRRRRAISAASGRSAAAVIRAPRSARRSRP